MGRLHTCYSPVRRSPAGKTEVLPPLPLDLHVLSLSLAFILSQDQTLRCCLSCFFFFQSFVRKTYFSISCLLSQVTLTILLLSRIWLRWHWTLRRFNVLKNWLEFLLLALVLLLFLSIVNLSMISVALFGSAEKLCKVKNNFWFLQIFFSDFNISSLRLRSGAQSSTRSNRRSSFKASAKVHPFSLPTKYFCIFFIHGYHAFNLTHYQSA